ncbi:hypothetical protein VTK56DRAFT_748 [Thermocarpiscus australiensis]
MPPSATTQLPTPQALPTPRALLTSLMTAISAIPLLPPDGTGSSRPGGERESETDRLRPHPSDDDPARDDLNNNHNNNNPLRRVAPAHRPLLVTLHVLFPGMVLPALDLLERGLVGRVRLEVDEEGVGSTEHGDGDRDCFYLVGSSAAASAAAANRRRGKRRGRNRSSTVLGGGGERDDGDGEGGDGGLVPGMMGMGSARGYVVRLGAWNCTCGAFAFAFAAAAAAAAEGEGATLEDEKSWHQAGSTHAGRAEADWSFGGMSLDGLEGGSRTDEGVPVCKHLLACLLADRWSVALGRYVIERTVGREEMAGIVADV